jgi:hypothetical protein
MPSDPLMPKRRGRPRKQQNTTSQGSAMPSTEATANGIGVTFADKRTDIEVINEVLERFNVLRKLAKGIGERKVKSLILSGAAGIGKTYTLTKILEMLAAQSEGTDKATRFKKSSGYITTIELYRLLYEYRNEGDVLMLDDTDNVFYDDNSLNILKAVLDTMEHRIVSYRTKSSVDVTTDDGEPEDLEADELPNEFEFKGSVVFVTNIDFHAFLEAGKNRVTPHIAALLNRTLYLDMALHTPRAVALWIKYMMERAKMLEAPEHGMTPEQSAQILEYILANYDRIYKASLRTAVKLAELVRLDPEDWRVMANVVIRKPLKA